MGRNFIPIEVVFNQISCFKKRIFHFDRFPNATRYPWLREILDHTVRDGL